MGKVLGESILEEDSAILELGIVDMDNNRDIDTSDQIPKVVQRVQRKSEKKNYIEESDEEETPKKKKKEQEIKKLASPNLSWFEENVMKKNIEERKNMEKALGLDRLAEDLRKISKGFMNNLDLMYNSDESD